MYIHDPATPPRKPRTSDSQPISGPANRAVPVRPTLLRPILLPGLRRMWRSPYTLQLGLDPTRAVVVELANPVAARLLDLLDGAHTERSVLDYAARCGVAQVDAHLLLDTLRIAGLVVGAQTLLPNYLPEHGRRRLTPEAVAIALRSLDGSQLAAARARTAQPSPTTPTPRRNPASPVDAAGPVEATSSAGATGPAGAGPAGTMALVGTAGPVETTSSADAAGPADVAGSGYAAARSGGSHKPADPIATPAQVLRRRAAARVVVIGRGRLASAIALTLAHAGIGHVVPALDGRVAPGEMIAGGLLGTDLDRPRSVAVAEAIVRVAPGTATKPVRRGEASFLVQVGVAGTGGPATLHATAYAQRRLAHLAVAIRDGTAVVGPLVPPAGSPCLNCLDLHRRERDPAWPAMAAQLAAEATSPVEVVEPCAATTLLAATAFATAEVLAYLDGGAPDTAGATIEIAAAGQHRRRTWPPHRECGCATRSRRARVRPATPYSS